MNQLAPNDCLPSIIIYQFTSSSICGSSAFVDVFGRGKEEPELPHLPDLPLPPKGASYPKRVSRQCRRTLGHIRTHFTGRHTFRTFVHLPPLIIDARDSRYYAECRAIELGRTKYTDTGCTRWTVVPDRSIRGRGRISRSARANQLKCPQLACALSPCITDDANEQQHHHLAYID